MGLADILDADGIPFHHPCFYEHSAYSGIGRRTCDVPDLRSNRPPQAERQVPRICADHRHVPPVRLVDLCERKRYLPVFFQVVPDLLIE